MSYELKVVKGEEIEYFDLDDLVSEATTATDVRDAIESLVGNFRPVALSIDTYEIGVDGNRLDWVGEVSEILWYADNNLNSLNTEGFVAWLQLHSWEHIPFDYLEDWEDDFAYAATVDSDGMIDLAHEYIETHTEGEGLPDVILKHVDRVALGLSIAYESDYEGVTISGTIYLFNRS